MYCSTVNNVPERGTEQCDKLGVPENVRDQLSLAQHCLPSHLPGLPPHTLSQSASVTLPLIDLPLGKQLGHVVPFYHVTLAH